MRKLEVKHGPIKFACVFCNDQRSQLVDPESDGPLFLADVNGDGKSESIDFLLCRCGAEFHWARAGLERPSGVPEDYAALPVQGVVFKGWRLFAVKEPLHVKTYTLTSNRPAMGNARSWAQRIIRIPSSFKLIHDGAFISHHAQDGSIILKPVEAKTRRKHE
jgi:hypothetical protein